MKREPDVCKSYTIHAEGGSLTLSETPKRLAIEVTVTEASIPKTVQLTKAQFQSLCGLDSSYDGLEVRDAPEPEEEEPEPEEDPDVVPA